MTHVKPIPEVEQSAVSLLASVLMQVRQEFIEGNWDGLRPSHLRVLTAVPAEGVTISVLAARVGMTKQGCGQFVRQLEQSGHLTREQPDSDRRQRVVRRTTLGNRFLRRSLGWQQAMEREWAERVGVRRYRSFRAVLEELAHPPA